MGVRILYDDENSLAALYCSTSDIAFGPVFHANTASRCADERAMSFLRWIATCKEWKAYDKLVERVPRDVRQLTERGLERAYSDWLAQEAAQWAAEDETERIKYQD